MSHISVFSFTYFYRVRIRQLSFAALHRFLSSPVCATGFQNSSRQLKPMATYARVPCVSAHTDNYLWHDCQLNIVPAPGLASQPCLAYLSASPREPFSSNSCTGWCGCDRRQPQRSSPNKLCSFTPPSAGTTTAASIRTLHLSSHPPSL